MNAVLSTEPVFNIKSVSEQTGIPPVTLRAWERRYGFPETHRTEAGYRLYSEADIAGLNWLKLKTEEGLAIGQAVKLLRQLIDRGESPLVKGFAVKDVVAQGYARIGQVQPDLIRALVALDEVQAHRVLQAAFALFPLEDVLLQVIQPVMIEVGERWHSGEISVATEHFATQHCRLYIMKALEAANGGRQNGSIVAACAPGEWHELGLLMLVVLLRLRGWNVTYLGPNLSLERLNEALEALKPQLLLFSASGAQSAANLDDLIGVLDLLPEPKPIIGLGGQAFLNDPTLTNRLPGTFLGPDAADALRQIERMLPQAEAA